MDSHYRQDAVDFSDPATLDLDAVLQQIERHWADGAPVVIAEGIFALTLDAVRSRACLSVWLEVPLDIGLARKLLRKLDAGADIKPSIRGYLDRGRAGYLRHVLPGRDHADLRLDGTDPVEQLLTAVLDKIPR